MPPWLIEIIGKSPIVASIAAIAYFMYKAIDRAMDSPESIATCFLLAGKERRKDALVFLRALRGQDEDDPPEVKRHPRQIVQTPSSEERWRRDRRRRKRRR